MYTRKQLQQIIDSCDEMMIASQEVLDFPEHMGESMSTIKYNFDKLKSFII